MGSRWDEIGPNGSAYKPTSSSAGKTYTQPSVSASTGGTGASGGSSLGNILTAGGMILGGLTGGLGSTSQGSGSWGGTNNGVTIGGTMGSAETAMQYNREMMETANKTAAEEAQKNRDWQKMMSDTAFQRAVEDMKKTGINPILAAGTQAPMGSGSAATTHMATGMPEQYNWGQTSGSQWGVNNSYSYNNFAEGISEIMETLADVIANTKDKETGKEAGKAIEKIAGTAKEAGKTILNYIVDSIREGVGTASGSAKSMWNRWNESERQRELRK